MRILKVDQKEGFLQLSLQALEDLWHLHKILEPGDHVRAKTYRKVAIKRGQEIHEGERKPVNLTIQLEKSEFHQYTGKLRLSGKIVSGPDDIQLASKHTIQVEPGMLVSVKKEKLKSFQLDRIKKARVKEADIFFCCLDRDQADFAELKEFGLQMKGSMAFRKVAGEDNRDMWHEKIIESLESQDCGKIIVCGPGFEAQNLYSYMRKQNPELAKKTSVEHSSDIGKPGIREVIKVSGDKILKESRLARETEFIQKLLIEIKKKGLAVYKKEAVEKAIEYGALDTLLISDTKVRDFEQLLDKAEAISSNLVVISTEHEPGEQLLSLGGIAGFLRFRLP